jgi:trehalose 2-sulfotransferase
MYAHDKLDHEFEGARTRLSYAVCALPRSGSSLLCELLFGTGLAGAPVEYFDAEQMARFSERWGTPDFAAYVRALLQKKTGPNGVFGFKAHFFQLAEAFPGGRLESTFPALRYVYISRRDRLRQAISWARAEQTGKWASDHEPAREVQAVFDSEQIERLAAGIRERERAWEAWFERKGIGPIRITYEDLVEAPEATVRAVLRHIGIETPEQVAVGPPTLAKQGDLLTEQWMAQW